MLWQDNNEEKQFWIKEYKQWTIRMQNHANAIVDIKRETTIFRACLFSVVGLLTCYVIGGVPWWLVAIMTLMGIAAGTAQHLIANSYIQSRLTLRMMCFNHREFIKQKIRET